MSAPQFRRRDGQREQAPQQPDAEIRNQLPEAVPAPRRPSNNFDHGPNRLPAHELDKYARYLLPLEVAEIRRFSAVFFFDFTAKRVSPNSDKPNNGYDTSHSFYRSVRAVVYLVRCSDVRPILWLP